MDIVERLRERARPKSFRQDQDDLLIEAAEEIERLREALGRIEEIGEHLVWPVAEMRNTAMLALQGKELE